MRLNFEIRMLRNTFFRLGALVSPKNSLKRRPIGTVCAAGTHRSISVFINSIYYCSLHREYYPRDFAVTCLYKIPIKNTL